MSNIYEQLRDLQSVYSEYEGVERFTVNTAESMTDGIVVVLNGSTIPSTFTRLMIHEDSDINWIQPEQSVTIRLAVDERSRFLADPYK